MLQHPSESKPSLFERIVRSGATGVSALMVVGTVCGIAVYSFVQGIDTDTANRYHDLVLISAGATLIAVGSFIKNGSGPTGTT